MNRTATPEQTIRTESNATIADIAKFLNLPVAAIKKITVLAHVFCVSFNFKRRATFVSKRKVNHAIAIAKAQVAKQIEETIASFDSAKHLQALKELDREAVEIGFFSRKTRWDF